MATTKMENMIKELAKLGITNEEELNEAIKNQQPLDITIMVVPVAKRNMLKTSLVS